MVTLEAALAPVARSAEQEIKPRLAGFLGGFLRAYLPQVWEFRTEAEVRYLVVAPDGTARVAAEPPGPADVTISGPHEPLTQMLLTRRRPPGSAGEVRVTTHTAKGKAAYDQLRARLGV